MPTLVEVVWKDAWSDEENFNTLHGVTVTHAPMLVRTLGWCLLQDETGISVANERANQDGHEVYRGRTFIPHAMVVSVTPFALSRPRKPKESPCPPSSSSSSSP